MFIFQHDFLSSAITYDKCYIGITFHERATYFEYSTTIQEKKKSLVPTLNKEAARILITNTKAMEHSIAAVERE
jgi:hypothetical protein